MSLNGQEFLANTAFIRLRSLDRSLLTKRRLKYLCLLQNRAYKRLYSTD
jgi:hypothetical protein